MLTASLLIFSLILEYIYEPISDKGINSIIQKSFESFKGILEDIITKTLILFLFPVALYILINLLISIVGFVVHPFFSFLINLLILFHCLKPNQFRACIDKLEDKEELETHKNNKNFTRMMKSSKLIYEEILSQIFYNSTRIIYTVTFFFLMLGPAGALSYLIVDSYINESTFKIDTKSKKIIKNILGVIEFIPIQLTVLSFALVSDFEICVRSYKSTKNEDGLYNYNRTLITNVGNNLVDQSIENLSQENELDVYKNILSRSFLAWLSVIVLFIFGGFFI